MGAVSKVILVGPGRAGTAVSLALVAAGHRVAGVLARRSDAARDAAALLGAESLGWDPPLPEADLLIVAVSDDAIPEVAARLAPLAGASGGAVHLSGLAPVAALEPLGGGIPLGSFHPLQTLPTPEAGAARLEGAWVAITAGDPALAERLWALAHSIRARPFAVADDVKPLYHAAAAAAANYPLAALEMARRLFDAAGVPFEAARPLVAAVVDNAFDLGPAAALTGPIARGDVATVAAQRSAVASAAADLGEDFASFGRAVARIAGRDEELGEVLG